jgi:hypothetical protein
LGSKLPGDGRECLEVALRLVCFNPPWPGLTRPSRPFDEGRVKK